MIEEKQIVDAVTYRDNGCIEVREASIITKNGIEIAKTFHRYVVEPGADLTNEPDAVRTIAEGLWTPELIDAYRASIEQII
jgi:hypothetical protein